MENNAILKVLSKYPKVLIYIGAYVQSVSRSHGLIPGPMLSIGIIYAYINWDSQLLKHLVLVLRIIITLYIRQLAKVFFNMRCFLWKNELKIHQTIRFYISESYLSFQGVFVPEMFLLDSFQYFCYFDLSKFACAHG